MKATLTKNHVPVVSKEIENLIQEAEGTIKKISTSKDPYKEFQDDRVSRNRISRFPLEELVGKVTLSQDCPAEILGVLKASNMSPHRILVK